MLIKTLIMKMNGRDILIFIQEAVTIIVLQLEFTSIIINIKNNDNNVLKKKIIKCTSSSTHLCLVNGQDLDNSWLFYD